MSEKENKIENNIDNEKMEKLKKSISNIRDKKTKFLICIPDSENPAASIYELYFHATTIKNMGYKVIVLTETDKHVKPSWIEESLTDIEHQPMSKSNIIVSPEDIMIIPEVYTNIMEQTKNLPCLRVGVLQSMDYMLNALIPGTDWSNFGIKDIITTSESLNYKVETFYGENKFNLKKYDLGIPDYFKKSDKPQKPIISIIGRNPNEISKFVKLFYARYPQYGWVSFDTMLTNTNPPKQPSRIEFAKKLGSNFAAVWIDRISSFGTFPLECMKVGTIPICLKPDITPDYLIERDENNEPLKIVEGGGVWTENYYDLPLIVGDILVKFLDDSILPELYESMENISAKYTSENSKKQLEVIYNGLLEDRIKFFENFIKEEE